MSASAPPEAPPPEALFFQMITGKWVTQSIGAAARLGFADAIGDGPTPVDAVAEACGTAPDPTYRLLRALAGLGFFAEDGERRFACTDLGAKLRSDVPGSLRAFAMMVTMEESWKAWGELDHCLRTGESGFRKAYGRPFFEHLRDHPGPAKVFDDSMTAISSVANPGVAAALDWGRFSRVADVAGGEGTLLCEILARHEHLAGVLFDLPHAVEEAGPVLAARGMEERVERVAGDMFEEVPGGCDAYVMKHIVHDWGDEACRTLLGNCARHLGPEGRVLVVEELLPPGDGFSPTKLLDLEMLVMNEGGRERTEDEFRALFEAAGLRLEALHPTEGSLVVLEARRA